jgi:hypothetical protein
MQCTTASKEKAKKRIKERKRNSNGRGIKDSAIYIYWWVVIIPAAYYCVTG